MTLIALIAVSTKQFLIYEQHYYWHQRVSKAPFFYQCIYPAARLVLSILIPDDMFTKGGKYLYDPSSIDYLKLHIFPENHKFYSEETEYFTFISDSLV